jgi:cation transport ATPase
VGAPAHVAAGGALPPDVAVVLVASGETVMGVIAVQDAPREDAAAGVTGLRPAILADTGATVLVTMNALRLLRQKRV